MDISKLTMRAQMIMTEFMNLSLSEKKLVLEELNLEYGFIIKPKGAPFDEDLKNKPTIETTTT